MKLISSLDENFLRILKAVVVFVALTALFSLLCRQFFLLYILAFLLVLFSGFPVHGAVESGRYQLYWAALVLSVVAGGAIGFFFDEILVAFNPLNLIPQK